MNAGHRLKKWRERSGYTQGGLAKLLGAEQGSVSRWERGLQLPCMRSAIVLARLSGGEIDVDGWLNVKRMSA